MKFEMKNSFSLKSMAKYLFMWDSSKKRDRVGDRDFYVVLLSEGSKGFRI